LTACPSGVVHDGIAQLQENVGEFTFAQPGRGGDKADQLGILIAMGQLLLVSGTGEDDWPLDVGAKAQVPVAEL
jgi:hypothetical protein